MANINANSWQSNAKDFLSSHVSAVQWWSKDNDRITQCLDFVAGQHWTAEDLRFFKQKKKHPVTLNYVRPTIRTAVGLFVQNKYAIKFAPFEPESQKISDVLEQLNVWNSSQQNDQFNDIDLYQLGWSCGRAYQLCHMEISSNGVSKMKTVNLNPLAVYWDPNSKHTIVRSDAQWVDLEWWLTEDAIIAMFPKKEKIIRDGLGSVDRRNQNYNQEQIKYRDREHETIDQRDGTYRVIQRFYKKQKFNNGMITEDLHELIMCPNISINEFLHDDLYHCQPRHIDPDDPENGEIIFPVLEFVAESLNGTISGFVDDQIQANKIINGALSNIYHNIRHTASAPTRLIEPDAFVSEAEAKRAELTVNDGDAIFRVKDGQSSRAIQNVPQSPPLNGDISNIVQISAIYQEMASASPKALTGMGESGVSGVLNEQRMQQAYTQHQQAVANWKAFLKQRVSLRYSYWRKYFTEEKIIRITGRGENEQEFLSINQNVPEIDQYGYPTGNITKWNDINLAPYDITVEDSQQSPTVRAQTASTLSTLLQNGSVQQDPVLSSMLTMHWLDLQNASQDLKDKFKSWSKTVQENQQSKQQVEQQNNNLSQIQQMQQIAQTEADQAGIMPDNKMQMPQMPQMPQMTTNDNAQFSAISQPQGG